MLLLIAKRKVVTKLTDDKGSVVDEVFCEEFNNMAEVGVAIRMLGYITGSDEAKGKFDMKLYKVKEIEFNA